VAKPVVDGLEREMEGQAQVLRLNVTDGVGGQLAARYNVRGVPTFVLLDGDGQLVLAQVGMPNRAEILTAVEELASQ
jgi:thioredoxin-related protein